MSEIPVLLIYYGEGNEEHRYYLIFSCSVLSADILWRVVRVLDGDAVEVMVLVNWTVGNLEN